MKELATKGHMVLKDKLQFCLPQVKYLGHLISKDELLINPERLRGILSFPLPKPRQQLREFLGLTGYCPSEVLNFSLMAQPLYVLLKSDQPDPIQWNSEEKQAV